MTIDVREENNDRRNDALHRVDPQAYIEDVLTKLVNLWPASRIDDLMPWAWARAQNSTERIAA